jgi:hypothetical protein
MPAPSLIELREAYARNQNITRLLRESTGSATNEQLAIQIAYDFQAGSYIEILREPGARAAFEPVVEAMAAVLSALRPRSLMEPGVGECTTLREVLGRLNLPSDVPVLGYDISWSRVHVGNRYLASAGVSARLFVGELEAAPLPDGAIDVVYTSHAVEPNHGREAEILGELYRVANRYLVLFEPGYEFAPAEARARMEAHGYCRGLGEITRGLGWRVVEHRPLGAAANPLNPTAVLVIEKSASASAVSVPDFACPSCRGRLEHAAGAYFCAAEGLAFPTLRDLPCLARHNAILAGRFLDG